MEYLETISEEDIFGSNSPETEREGMGITFEIKNKPERSVEEKREKRKSIEKTAAEEVQMMENPSRRQSES